MYKNIQNYKPLEHDNFEYKNNLIEIARKQDKTKVEGAFAAILIYANLIDYLARHLLENLLKMLSIKSFKDFEGILYFDGSKKKTNLPLGQLKYELDYFEFPGKIDFMKRLTEFNELRRNIMHNLMQRDPEETAKNIDKEIKEIEEISEDLLVKYNTICSGLNTSWNKSNDLTTQQEK